MKTCTCPICHTQVPWLTTNTRPFCSARCRTQDLAAWGTDTYIIKEDENNTADALVSAIVK